MSQPAELSDVVATLSANGSKARYGVSYVRNVCAQAGVGMTETPADEDVLAVDCTVDFAPAPVRVQVKCTSQFTIAGRQASWKIEPGWLRAWKDSKIPVYFVLVIVQGEPTMWLDHRPKATLHNAAAFWHRVDQLPPDTTSLTIVKKRRLTVATVQEWRADLLACFGGVAAS
jgi:hypothetical protein